MLHFPSWSPLTKLALLGALTWACSEEPGDKGNLAGAGNDDSEAPRTPGTDDESDDSPVAPPDDDDEPLPNPTDALDAQCDPEKLPFGGGEGTEKSPYLLCATSQLEGLNEQFSNATSLLSAHFSLTRDLDFGGATLTPLGRVGTRTFPFTGVFDGHDHSISHFEIVSSDPQVGFFATLGAKGRISRLSLENAKVEGATVVGGLVGQSSGEISNCHFRGDVSASEAPGASGQNVGGLVGYAGYAGDGTLGRSPITDSSSSGSVRGKMYVGGLIGRGSNLLLLNSSSDSTVTSEELSAGGLVGQAISSDLRDSTARGQVTGPQQTGGAVGYAKWSSLSKIQAHGDVKGGGFTGGVIGWADLDCILTNSSGHGEVEGTRAVGGFAGAITQTSVTRSWASGTTRGVNFVGGFLGIGGSNSSAWLVYALGDVSGREDLGGLFGQVGAQVGDFAHAYTLGQIHLTDKENAKNVGPIFGSAGAVNKIQSCYFLSETAGDELSGQLTQAQFGEPTSFSGWDFFFTWELDPTAQPFARPVFK